MFVVLLCLYDYDGESVDLIGKCESHYLPEVCICPSAPIFLLFIFAIIVLCYNFTIA